MVTDCRQRMPNEAAGAAFATLCDRMPTGAALWMIVINGLTGSVPGVIELHRKIPAMINDPRKWLTAPLGNRIENKNAAEAKRDREAAWPCVRGTWNDLWSVFLPR